MKQKARLLLTLFFSMVLFTAKSQNCDPWITQAYNELYGEPPTSSECNIKKLQQRFVA